MVPNTAARILTKTIEFDHIRPILVSLHCFPIHVISDFKVLLMSNKGVNEQVPSYLSARRVERGEVHHIASYHWGGSKI